MTLIKWTLRRVGGDPTVRAKEFIAKRPREGVVFVQKPVGKGGFLRFSAVANCSRETALLMRLIAAFCASEGLRKDTGIISWVRWPSVVTIEGRSVATTSACVTPKAERVWVELDFQVNILESALPGATSLYEELGVEVDGELLLEKILESVTWMHFGWSNEMQPQILRRVRSMTETLGSRVTARRGGVLAVGSAVEIDELGRLVLRLDDGKTVRLGAGDELVRS